MILEEIAGPDDLRELGPNDLERLAAEIREFLVAAVSRTGGHLGPNLGVVELTLALHRVFDSPRDALVFDTGHQAYVHKMVTGRLQQFDTLRQEGGLFGYPSPAESEHDPVYAAHAGHSISLAAGVAMANAVLGQEGEAVAIIGDGAMTAGMAYEALDHLGAASRRVIVVLNDNGMSICSNVGGLTSHLRGRALGTGPATPFFWEGLGIRCIGPVDGHDIAAMERAFAEARHAPGPVLVHVCTVKGKGDPQAEADAAAWHDMPPAPLPGKKAAASWSSFAADAIVQAAERDPRVVARPQVSARCQEGA